MFFKIYYLTILFVGFSSSGAELKEKKEQNITIINKLNSGDIIVNLIFSNEQKKIPESENSKSYKLEPGKSISKAYNSRLTDFQLYIYDDDNLWFQSKTINNNSIALDQIDFQTIFQSSSIEIIFAEYVTVSVIDSVKTYIKANEKQLKFSLDNCLTF